MPDSERIFLRRQYRRRLQISVLIGISGLCMFLGLHVSHITQPMRFLLAWGLAIIFLSWTILLALVDVMSIRLYFKRVRNKNLVEELKIRYELEKKIKENEERSSSGNNGIS